MEDDIQDSTGQEADMVQDNKMPSSGTTQRGTEQRNHCSTAGTSGNKVSVYQAAYILGVTVDAIRKRIQRRTIPHERDGDGRVWVLLDESSIIPDEGENVYQTRGRDELVDSLKDQVEYLRQVIETRNIELQRKDSIIAALTQRVPELEPPGRSSVANQTPGEGLEGIVESSPHAEDLQEKERRSWWRRFTGR